MLKPFPGKFILVYFDDILIYRTNEVEDLEHLRQIVTVLQANKLYINLKKCIFLQTSLIFMGFVVSGDEICIDKEKVKVI